MNGHGARLDSILSNLGGTLLEEVAGHIDPAVVVTDVVIDERHGDEPLRPGAVLLCAGADAADIPALIERAVAGGAAAVVLRGPLDVDEGARTAVENSGLVLLALTRGASWAQLVVLLRSLLSSSIGGAGEELLAGFPAGDSFALANAIGALLDAPITIEDRDSQVLAFSGRQDEADRTRIQTVLGRVVPQHARHAQERAGVFKRLYASEKPIFVDTPLIEGVAGLPRVAMAVRAGDQVLGSIWVAVPGPLNSEKEQILVDAAKVVALHLLRHRVGVDVDRQVRADLIATALAEGPAAPEAIERLRLARRPVTVMAMAVSEMTATSAAGAPTSRQLLERTADALAFHLSVVTPGSVAALVGDVCYAIVPSSAPDADTDDLPQKAQSAARDFLRRASDGLTGVVVGIGRTVDSAGPADLARSRHDADRTLRVLRQRSRRRVARYSEVQVDALLLELGDLLHKEGGLLDGPIQHLRTYDQENGTTLVDTLTAWLDSLGNVLSAATSLDVHPNTFRYRLRRAGEIAGMDLNDPEKRFAAMLELRILRAASP
ncbi:PucR family transcriptional regulator [Streptomyces sp. NPDC058385]|uniref:PucR family transcriptional regulator n=1 Tax=Streptomyces sp. NPDC058385 TaxID=3346473 RepID=UPI003660D512